MSIMKKLGNLPPESLALLIILAIPVYILLLVLGIGLLASIFAIGSSVGGELGALGAIAFIAWLLIYALLIGVRKLG